MSDLPSNSQIKIGITVLIESKQDQGTGKLTKGIVAEKLTPGESHPYGIMVKLEDGTKGRVKEIFSDSLSNKSQNIRSKIYEKLKNTSLDELSKKNLDSDNSLKDSNKSESNIPENEDTWNELKSSFRADIDRITKGDGKIVSSKSVEKEISITISALANKEGGQLFIGVDDNGDILGLNSDYELLKNPSDDKFQRIIWQSIKNYLGNMTFVSKLDMTLTEKNSKKIYVIKIPKSNEPIFVNDDDGQESYVRVGTRSEKFSPQDFIKYCNSRFND